MARSVMHINDNPNRTHPLKRAHAQAYKSIRVKIDIICKECGWAIATYYRKLRQEDPLTEYEAEVVASVWGISVADISTFQNGFIKSSIAS